MLWPVSQSPNAAHTAMTIWFPRVSSQVCNAASRVLPAAGADTAYGGSATKLDMASRQNAASARGPAALESPAWAAVIAPPLRRN